MGQYHIICNIDKKEYLHPHKFGQGLKFLEFAASGDGIMFGLAFLLADSQGRGGGDIRSGSELLGSWAGDRIVITGDCGDETYVPEEEPDTDNLYDYARLNYTDISDPVIAAISKAEPRSRLAGINLGEIGWRHAYATT